MKKVHAFVSMGQGGRATCPGTVALVERMRAAGISTMLFEWSEIHKIAPLVEASPDGEIVAVGGTSLGANEAPRVAALAAPRRVDYLFGIQPSWYGEHNMVPSNVIVARTWRNPWWFPVSAGFGVYTWQLKPGNTRTKLAVETTLSPHPGDWVDGIQQSIVDDIKKLL